MTDESDESTESNLWDCEDLSIGDVMKLGKHDLTEARRRVEIAIRRHEYLRSPSGQSMIQLSMQQSIARIRQSELSFIDWLENRSADSLARLKRQMQRVDAETESRLAKSSPRRSIASGPSARKLALAELICSDDDMRLLIVKKHGSVEQYAASL